MFQDRDYFWMRRAIELAELAAKQGEVPVGAVLVLDDEMIGEAYNRPITLNDPTGHAEILALRAGAEKIANYRIMNATLYVTLEPCIMCAGAMVHARIKRLVYGASDVKAGAVSSKLQTLDEVFLNHAVQHQGGLLEQECGEMLSKFFQERRK